MLCSKLPSWLEYNKSNFKLGIKKVFFLTLSLLVNSPSWAPEQGKGDLYSGYICIGKKQTIKNAHFTCREAEFSCYREMHMWSSWLCYKWARCQWTWALKVFSVSFFFSLLLSLFKHGSWRPIKTNTKNWPPVSLCLNNKQCSDIVILTN